MDSLNPNKRMKLDENINDEFNNIPIQSLYIAPITTDVSCHFFLNIVAFDIVIAVNHSILLLFLDES